MESTSFQKQAIVIDGLNASVLDRNYLKKLIVGGVTAINLTIAEKENCSEAIKNIANLTNLIEENADLGLVVRSTHDIIKAKEEGKAGIIFGFQDTQPLEGKLELLKIFKALGVKIIQITYNEANLMGTGCGEKKDAGLSFLGREAIKRMNKLGILIDLSHVGDVTSLEAIELSDKPVVFSHSNARSLCNNVRNKPDELIKALAEKGGVIGVNAYPAFLNEKPKQASITDLLNHIDYLVNLVGVNHVGIGLDLIEGKEEQIAETLKKRPDIWGTVYSYPKDINTITKFPNIVKGLVERGYSNNDVKKIIGENFLRVYREAWLE
jgi:membrane dipeptidase